MKIGLSITKQSGKPGQKYYQLKEPIFIPAKSGVSDAIYTHLYIRKPDLSPFGQYLGDVDFVMEPDEYKAFRDEVEEGEIKGAQVYDRVGWDAVQISDPEINSVAFVMTRKFASKIRFRFT